MKLFERDFFEKDRTATANGGTIIEWGTMMVPTKETIKIANVVMSIVLIVVLIAVL